MNKSVAVLGAGSWGTALALVLANKGYKVNLWGRNSEYMMEMDTTRINRKYLPEIKLSDNITMCTDIHDSIRDVEIIVLSVSAQAIRSVVKQIADEVDKDQIFVNVSKGVENGSLLRISQIVGEYCEDNEFVCLSGPSHAEEVCKEIPTTLVAASRSKKTAEYIQDTFSTDKLRVYTNPDLVGVELGGALKNVIALGAGISDGLGYGDNSKAALMTRGIKEIARLGAKMGGAMSTFAGLSGIGDLIVTCTSMHSRNRRCGILLGKGKKLDEALDEIGMVVEGIYTVKAVFDLSQKYGVEMPITEQIYNVLYKDASAYESVSKLMLRSMKHELEDEILSDDLNWERN